MGPKDDLRHAGDLGNIETLPSGVTVVNIIDRWAIFCPFLKEEKVNLLVGD